MSAPTSWRTALTEATDEEVRIRGYDLRDLVGRISFAEGILLMARGELPTLGEARVLEAIFVSVLDRGIVPCSIVTRYLASSGAPLQAAVAGGILSFGDVYGGAGEQLAQALADNIGAVRAGQATREEAARRVVRHFTDRGLRVPGYGSAVHRGGDPRVPRLFAVAEEGGVLGDHSHLAMAVEAELSQVRGRKLGLNQDGALAALCLDLKLDWRLMRPLAFIPRSAGLAMHALEEMTRESGWRHVPNAEVAYDGPPARPFPARAGEAT
jgi:citrate synthase